MTTGGERLRETVFLTGVWDFINGVTKDGEDNPGGPSCYVCLVDIGALTLLLVR